MKKILLIITIVMSILLFDKVSAKEVSGNAYSQWYDYSGNNIPWLTGSGTYYVGDTVQLPSTSTAQGNKTFYTTNDRTKTIDLNGAEKIELFTFIDIFSESVYYNNGYSDQSDPSTTLYYNYYLSKGILASFSLRIYDANDNWVSCKMTSNNMNAQVWECPITLDMNHKLNRVQFGYMLESPTSGWSLSTVLNNFRIGISRGINVYKTVNDDITNAIQNSTNEIINQNATYTDDPYEEVNGTQEVNDYNNLENEIMSSLNFDVNETQQITFNPQASLWIWNIAERLRGINPAIVLLMTSMLGIGVIKMVLNR